MPRLAFTPKNANVQGDTLVVIFLRGAADALNMSVPHGEDVYYDLRPGLGIPRPDDNRAKANERALNAVGVGEMWFSVPVSALRSIAGFHLGGDGQALAQMQAILGALYFDYPLCYRIIR